MSNAVKNGETSKLDYYYGKEAEQFAYIKVPKLLFTDEKYKNLTPEAKLLYSLMLDRMKLSMKNGWFDKQNRAYIFFKIEDIKEYLACGDTKAVKLMADLDSKKGVGLIEKTKQGLGRPDIIYVKKMVNAVYEANKPGGEKDNESVIDKFEPSKESFEGEFKSYDDINYDDEFLFGKCVQDNEISNDESKIVDFENTADLKGSDDVNYENYENLADERQDFQNLNTNKTKYINTKNNKTKNNKSNQSIYHDTDMTKCDNQTNKTDMIDEMDKENVFNNFNTATAMPDVTASKESKPSGKEFIRKYESTIRENIDYDTLCQSYDKDEVDEIVDNMVEIMCMKQEHIRIAKSEVYTELAKNRVMKMDMFKVKYILDCMSKNCSKIANIKSYLRTAIYNASSTISNYYKNAVNHGMENYYEQQNQEDTSNDWLSYCL